MCNNQYPDMFNDDDSNDEKNLHNEESEESEEFSLKEYEYCISDFDLAAAEFEKLISQDLGLDDVEDSTEENKHLIPITSDDSVSMVHIKERLNFLINQESDYDNQGLLAKYRHLFAVLDYISINEEMRKHPAPVADRKCVRCSYELTINEMYPVDEPLEAYCPRCGAPPLARVKKEKRAFKQLQQGIKKNRALRLNPASKEERTCVECSYTLTVNEFYPLHAPLSPSCPICGGLTRQSQRELDDIFNSSDSSDDLPF